MLKRELEKKFDGTTVLFGSGRESLLALLMSLDAKPEDEVILQGYTCVVVPNAIQAAGLVPVYVDIDQDTLNLSMDTVKEAITPKTRAIICQHTFGVPADTKALRTICDDHKIFFIEDCAHVLPDEKGPSEIGRLGDALILSFGRDKAISGVSGGAVICRKSEVTKKILSLQSSARDLSFWTIMKFLEYPQIYAFCRPFYGLWIGKVKLALLGKLGFLVPILSKEEKHGHMEKVFTRMPNACAYLAVRQLHQLQQINDHRRMLTAWYETKLKGMKVTIPSGIHHDLPLQKFPVFINSAPRIRAALKKKNIYLEDGWSGCVVCPANVEVSETGYEQGLDPEAEKVCTGILSLPTHPGMTVNDAEFLIQSLRPFIS
jgi:dTDP-4-amino-4,6-dideoxygalactose transaminase